jgi:1-phosphofructokinase family hexose kinase
MIVTVTLNPAVDQTLWVERLSSGAEQRSSESQLDPAGKGINVSRMSHRLGAPTIALGFVAGEVGHIVERALDGERVQHHFVRVAGQTRIDVTIHERHDHRATSVFTRGPEIPGEALARLDEVLRCWLPATRVLVLAGSLPPGVPADWYARAVERARAAGVKTFVDADGEPARLVLAAHPWLVKPNVAEAERLLGRSLTNPAEVLRGARELVRGGVEVAVISMGEEGAFCVGREAAWRIRPPEVERRSTVGSGDSLVAGIAVAVAHGDTLEEGLRLGTAAGAATAMAPGTALGTPEEIASLLPAVRIDRL